MSLLTQASLVVTPNGYKEGTLYSVVPNNSNGDFSVTRATTATRVNAAGLVELVPYNLLQYSERFSMSPWSLINGATIAANTTTAPDGTLTADTLTFNGTAFGQIQQASTRTTGDVLTFSLWIKSNTFTSIDLYIGSSPSSVAITSSWQRVSITKTLGANDATPKIVSSAAGSVDIWGAQLVQGSSALDYQATETRLNIPRLDYSLGSCPNILLEPQRTNLIRNSTMVGASAPSTLPTNWVRQNTSGLTQTIVGIGTENGVNYIDINLQGIAVSANDVYSFDSSISASIGQSWTSSWYFKLVTSTPNAVRLAIQEFNGGAFLNVVTQDITPTTTLARYAQTKTLVGTGVTNVRAMIYVNFVIGQTYNTTIRLAAPQMEQGPYATSYIPTTSASVTRNADVISRGNIFTNGLITASGGTWFVDLRNNRALLRDNGNNSLLIGSALSDSFFFRNINVTSSRYVIGKTIAGVATNLFVTNADNIKIAIKWNGTTADIFANGVKVITATAFTGTTMNSIDSSTNVQQPININSMALFPTPLTDTQCIALTT